MTAIRRICAAGTALLMLAALLLALPIGAEAASASDFTDVSSSAWYYGAVDFVAGRGYFQGTEANKFSPGGTMTRGMFITVLGRYAGVDPAAWCTGQITGSGVNLRSGPGTGNSPIATLNKGDQVTLLGQSGDWYQVRTGSGTGYVSAQYVSANYHRFSDVSYGQYFSGYAVWAFEKGIVTGDGSADVFSPNGNVTREQVCSLLNRFASVTGLRLKETTGQSAFSDDGTISSWSKNDVYAMQRCGIVEGDENAAFNPRGSATRAQAAAMLQRFYNACGGVVPTPQDPTPPQTSTPAPGQSAPPSETPDPNAVPDTPATLIGGTVPVKASVIRVGILVKTGGIDTSVSSVTLQNVGGSGFEYGVMSGRSFSYGGSIADSYITVTADGAAMTVCDSTGAVVYTTADQLAIHPAGGGKGLTCVNGEYRYYGDFELRQASGKPGYISVINYLGIEDYVKGVVPYEFSLSWPDAAMKMAAIVCRSYAMSYDWNIYAPYGMDIVTGAGTQLYRGRGITYSDATFAQSDAAVDATAGLYLTYDGAVCITCFSSCDGGQTLDSSAVFGTSYPYLVGKADPFEQAAAGDIARAGGNYSSMVSASHRVGLSAWGAYAMAQYYGKSYESILGFYYTGTHLQYGA